MAQTGYTPISLYYSTTPAAVPLGADLVAGELALNTIDEKLYFKNSSGTVKLLASVAGTTNVSSISFGSTGLTPSTATTGAVTVAGTLAIANGGTGSTSTTYCSLTSNVTGTLPIGNGGTDITTYTAGDILYASATNTLAKLPIGTTGQLLSISGGIPAWSAAPSTGLTVGTTSITSGTNGYILYNNAGTLGNLATTGSGSVVLATSPTLVTPLLGTPTSGTLTNCTGYTTANLSGSISLTTQVSGTLPVGNGGTGATTITANSVILGNGTSSLSANLVAPGSAGNVLTSNGTTWTSAAAGGGQLSSQLFTGPGTWTKPSSCTQVRVYVIGGGGGGGCFNGAGSIPGNPAGAGGLAVAIVPVSAPVSITVGGGGNGSGGGPGGSGGTSSFGPAVSATGGGGGGGGFNGSDGTGTISVGTAIRTGPAYLASGANGPSVYASASNAGSITGGQGLKLGSPTAVAFSATGIYAAGASGQYFQSPSSPAPSGGGVGGAVLVEFVG